MSAKSTLSEKWLQLSPKWRVSLAVGGLLVFLFAVAQFITRGGPRTRTQASAPTVTNLLIPKPKDLSPEQLAAKGAATNTEVQQLKTRLDAANNDNQTLARRIESLEKQLDEPKTNVSSDLAKELIVMKAQLEDLKRNPPSAKPPATSDGLPPIDTQPAAPTPPERTLRITGPDKPRATTAAQEEAKPIPYLSAGSMFEAVTLNGMDAPTNSVAQKNPVPALMRVKSEAVLPNKYNQDVKECFLLASGYGVLSSERANMRTETLSCVLENGKAIEAKLDGYIVGEDGKVGMRGRLVSKQGQMIAKSLVAGVLGGVSQALTPQQVPRLDLSSGGNSTISTQHATLGSIGETGVAKGFATAADSVSKFYLELAREMTPVVEIDAGRKVTVVLVKGIELK